MSRRIMALLCAVVLLCTACVQLPEDPATTTDTSVSTTAITTATSTTVAKESTSPSTSIGVTTTTTTTRVITTTTTTRVTTTTTKVTPSLGKIPAYRGDPYVEIDGNVPQFSASELVAKPFEYYSPLDSLGRCGVASACVGKSIMPTEERGEIGQVKPAGWHTVKYDVVDGKYLYNRCHLIGYQLTGENANERNLITGTRYLNVDGMLPFENLVADYVQETGHHVLYRVTPDYHGKELLARGLIMEAQSIEDATISFRIYAYNVQPDVVIDYATGESRLADYVTTTTTKKTTAGNVTVYVLNRSSKKFHYPSCSSAKQIKPENYTTSIESRDALIADGYSPCKRCKP